MKVADQGPARERQLTVHNGSLRKNPVCPGLGRLRSFSGPLFRMSLLLEPGTKS